ncbi:MAG: hydroxyethylthiazole kinase [Candidatus Aquicultor sp.]
MQEIINQFGDDLQAIRDKKPLIHHITNFVVMNETANATLCIGALPVMAHAKEEVEEMVGFAGALVLNIGTLTPELIDSMIIAGKKANQLGIPIVFDPVGAGATKLRTDASNRIMGELELAIIRGNSAEIGILAGAGGEIKGVEAVGKSEQMAEVAREFAARQNAVISVTGIQDIITDGERIALVSNGDPMMGTVTGTGCISTTITASFAAVQPDRFIAATGALTAYGIAGEKAAFISGSRPGTFHASLYDTIYALMPEDVIRGAKIELVQTIGAEK